MRDFLAIYGLELMLLICSVFIIWVGLRSKKSLIKHLFFNISAIFIVLFILELYLTIDNIPQSKIEYQEPYYTTNPELGYGVSDSSFSARATKSWIKSGEEIYDAYYSFADGRRVTPGSDTTSQRYSIFLGGSFTFGEGINDTETLPYYYNQLYSQKRNIRNYGFHGYGTHQVYTIAKNHLATDSALHASENVEIFYWFIDPHILRANGYSPWDQKSIRYIVENGKLKHTGTFDEQKNTHSLVMKYWKFVWTNSGIFTRIKPRVASRQKELELILRLIKETDQLLREQGFEFTVLVQNTTGSDTLFAKHYKDVRKRVLLYLEEQGIQFIYVNEALLKDRQDVGLFIPGDGHPTDEFNKRLADLIYNVF
ncbi:MAG: hypothetical protein HEP71_17145 [Roseivirga sp.]|nr:hypothetical protein [Roseivirga sp.]